MKKILILPVLLILFASCNKDLSHLNIDTKRPAVVPSATLFSNGVRNLADQLASPNVNLNIFVLITQQWTEVTYTDESNYDLGTRGIADAWWRGLYKNVLVNFEAARKYMATDVPDPLQRTNELAQLDIMEVYTYAILVNTYGNIPYKDALDPANFFPKYDDAKTVYYDLLSRLDADIAALNVDDPGFSSDQDLVYGGDVVKWKKLANSLKLRMGITIADSDDAKAKSLIEAAAPNAFTSNDDNASFTYFATTPNTNPVWTNLVASGRNDYVPATTMINMMSNLNDPRLPFYFDKPADSAYKGGTPGSGNTFANLSHPSALIEKPDFPYIFMSYSEVEFILAEAVERGYSVGGTAASHYSAAVTASMNYWDVSTSDINAYLAQPSVAYATAAGSYKEKIGIQKYLAYYLDGFDAWTDQRRLDFPALVAPSTAKSGYPVRYTYPVKEQNLNSANWTAASTAIGGDKVETKLFWDKF